MEDQLLYLQQNHAYAMMQSTYCVKSSGSLLSLSPALSNIFFRSSESCVVSLSRDEVAGLLFCCSRNSSSTAGSTNKKTKTKSQFLSQRCVWKNRNQTINKNTTHPPTQIHAKYHTNLYSFAYYNVRYTGMCVQLGWGEGGACSMCACTGNMGWREGKKASAQMSTGLHFEIMCKCPFYF